MQSWTSLTESVVIRLMTFRIGCCRHNPCSSIGTSTDQSVVTISDKQASATSCSFLSTLLEGTWTCPSFDAAFGDWSLAVRGLLDSRKNDTVLRYTQALNHFGRCVRVSQLHVALSVAVPTMDRLSISQENGRSMSIRFT